MKDPKTPIQRASSMDFEGQENLGVLPIELLVAVHLHTQQTTKSSRSQALPSKGDPIQSALIEEAIRAAALWSGR